MKIESSVATAFVLVAYMLVFCAALLIGQASHRVPAVHDSVLVTLLSEGCAQ